MEIIGEKKTFRYDCDFCNQDLEISYGDLKTAFWKLDGGLNPMYWCKCPNCGRKIYISRVEIAVIKLI